MSDIDLTTWQGFWETFRLPISMSLIGAVIGHYRKNGVVQMPIIVIAFEAGPVLKNCKWFLRPLRWLYIVYDFILFLFGLRLHRSQEKQGVWADLGFLGDLLVGVGTGIIAKCALAVVNSPSDFVVISTSLLAGFAGLSYLQKQQGEDFEEKVKESTKRQYTVSEETVFGQVAAGNENQSSERVENDPTIR